MKKILSLLLVQPLLAHHGQDFLVTLDTKALGLWEGISATSFESTRYSDSEEQSFTQTFLVGLPRDISLGATLRFSDDGSDEWASSSISPSFHWKAPSWRLGEQTLNFAIAGGWEIPLATNDGHSHSAPQQDCSGLIAIPSLYAACQQANANALSHQHGDHSHSGIHRHGESHGFLRMITETWITKRDRLAANLIFVIPEDGEIATGYALAYRREVSESLALGAEVIGDFDLNGEHLLFLTSTYRLNHHFSLTAGAATGLTSESPRSTLQALVTWRF